VNFRRRVGSGFILRLVGVLGKFVLVAVVGCLTGVEILTAGGIRVCRVRRVTAWLVFSTSLFGSLCVLYALVAVGGLAAAGSRAEEGRGYLETLRCLLGLTVALAFQLS
jgi:uncharacterized protein involved in response to NO